LPAGFFQNSTAKHTHVNIKFFGFFSSLSVRVGDTLVTIAARFESTVKKLLAGTVHVAVCCSVLHGVLHSVLQCVAVHCRELQRVI